MQKNQMEKNMENYTETRDSESILEVPIGSFIPITLRNTHNIVAVMLTLLPGQDMSSPKPEPESFLPPPPLQTTLQT